MIYFRSNNISSPFVKVLLILSFGSIISCNGGNSIDTISAQTQIEIGEDNITYIDGEPFFPIGMFHVYKWSSFKILARNYDTFDEIFSDIRDGGFNIVHTYQSNHYDFRFSEFLLKAEKYELKVVMPPTTNNDAVATLVKDVYHDMNANALISWYIADEPDGRVSPEVIRKYHDIVKEVDPYHLTSVVINNPEKYLDYMNVSDIFMIDPYPIWENANYEVTCVSDNVDAALEAMTRANVSKPLWVILQAFGYQDEDNQAWGWDREPTYEEERCMTYLAIVHGAKGIFYYCFCGPGLPGSGSDSYFIPNSPQHWEDVKSIARELEQFTPVLVSPDDVGECLEVNSPDIHFLLKNFQDRRYLFAVNSANQEVAATFSGFQVEPDQPGLDTLTVLFEQRELVVLEGGFSDNFCPYEVHIYAQEQ